MNLRSLSLPMWLALVAGASIVSFAGCADSIHLDPSGTTSHPQGEGGGGSNAACISNSDCAENRPVCDVPKGVCVQCLVYTDCGAFADDGSLVCSKGMCVVKGASTSTGGAGGAGGAGAGGGGAGGTSTGLGGTGGALGGGGTSTPTETTTATEAALPSN